MRIICYVRVSTAEQADSRAGLDAQRLSILREATRRGWAEADLDWIEDAGFSAKSMNRPGLRLALDALKRGEANVLAVSKMDRLSRSLLDFAGIMQRAQRESWTLLALDSPADLSTPSGEAMAGVLAVFAQLERRLIGQRTKEGMAAKAAMGVVMGRPRTLPDSVRARIFAEAAAGGSLSGIARGLAADGIATAQGGTWRASTVRKILHTA
jgi:DNA invertase Pin-like site-specific DNA recombinase